MESDSIIQVVKAIFSGTDKRNWSEVKNAMAEEVLLDYSSMTGNPAALEASEKIVETWKGFLPGFDKTHHQVSDFKVSQNGSLAQVYLFGKADHYISGEIWTVEGTYDVTLSRSDAHWKVTAFKFNFIKQSGNTTLPSKAAEIAKHKIDGSNPNI
jgi:SnoaL-like domain